MTIYQRTLILIFTALNMACGVNLKEKEVLINEVEIVKNTFAPDKRTALFNISIVESPSMLTLTGESNLPFAVDSLRIVLKAKNIKFNDEIRILPTADLNGKTNAVITISAANLRSNPKHSAELATQAILGTTVHVLKNEGGWYLIQTPDKYLAWVDAGGIALMNNKELTQWESKEKIIYTKTYGHAFATSNSKNRVSDLVAGSILTLLDIDEGSYKVQFPDGRMAFVPMNSAEVYNTWLQNLSLEEDALVETSKTLMGVPYLWGGTSTKGVDCSGFTKTIYFLNGMVIPRDASQQIHTGSSIDSLSNFDALRKGDLLFFGKKATDSTAEKVVHVGMWIGDNQFIHSSDMVRISSVDKNSPNYDEYNVNRYLRTKRLLKEKDKNSIELTKATEIKD